MRQNEKTGSKKKKKKKKRKERRKEKKSKPFQRSHGNFDEYLKASVKNKFPN